MQFLVLMLTNFLCYHNAKGYPELIEELGCHNTQFRLSCESLNTKIVIFEATFSQNDSHIKPPNTSCANTGHPPNKFNWSLYKPKKWDNFFHQKNITNGIIEVSFRHAINRRCSGVNYCSFVLSDDFEAASTLGPGAVYVRYACIHDFQPNQACNSSINVSTEGFVKTPGYPEYYTGDTTCLWTLKAPPSRRVKINFLDISLRGIAPYEEHCLDWLIVVENGLTLLSTCGDILRDVLIISDGQALNVTFKSSSKTLFPKRGFLFYYKAVGCPLLKNPRDGYLQYRNESFVHFKCCVGFVFPDTLSRDKMLKCYNENTWDSVILDCVNATELLKKENYTLKSPQDFPLATKEVMERADSIKDIIIPSIIICIIFVGNGIVLFFIYLQRKKLAITEKMELKELPSLKPEP